MQIGIGNMETEENCFLAASKEAAKLWRVAWIVKMEPFVTAFQRLSSLEFFNAMGIGAFVPSGAVSQLKVFAKNCLEGWCCGLNLLPNEAE